MGMIGHFKRITVAQLAAVMADQNLASDLMFPDDGLPTNDMDIDKAWHGLHFLLTGEAYGGAGPLAQAVLGGTEIGEDLGYGPGRYLTVAQVAEVSAALDALSEATLAERFDPESLRSNNIYPGVWMDGQDDLAYLLHGYQAIRDYYQAAATSADAMLLFLA